MAFEVRLSEAAEQDILEALRWYKEQVEGLDLDFQSELFSMVKTISNRPFLFSEKYSSVRVAFLKRFPYGIHYQADRTKKQLVIVGVFHTSQNPKKWKQRL